MAKKGTQEMYKNEHIIVLVTVNGIRPLKMYNPDIYYYYCYY